MITNPSYFTPRAPLGVTKLFIIFGIFSFIQFIRVFSLPQPTDSSSYTISNTDLLEYGVTNNNNYNNSPRKYNNNECQPENNATSFFLQQDTKDPVTKLNFDVVTFPTVHDYDHRTYFHGVIDVACAQCDNISWSLDVNIVLQNEQHNNVPVTTYFDTTHGSVATWSKYLSSEMLCSNSAPTISDSPTILSCQGQSIDDYTAFSGQFSWTQKYYQTFFDFYKNKETRLQLPVIAVKMVINFQFRLPDGVKNLCREKILNLRANENAGMVDYISANKLDTHQFEFFSSFHATEPFNTIAVRPFAGLAQVDLSGEDNNISCTVNGMTTHRLGNAIDIKHDISSCIDNLPQSEWCKPLPEDCPIDPNPVDPTPMFNVYMFKVAPFEVPWVPYSIMQQQNQQQQQQQFTTSQDTTPLDFSIPPNTSVTVKCTFSTPYRFYADELPFGISIQTGMLRNTENQFSKGKKNNSNDTGDDEKKNDDEDEEDENCLIEKHLFLYNSPLWFLPRIPTFGLNFKSLEISTAKQLVPQAIYYSGLTRIDSRPKNRSKLGGSLTLRFSLSQVDPRSHSTFLQQNSLATNSNSSPGTSSTTSSSSPSTPTTTSQMLCTGDASDRSMSLLIVSTEYYDDWDIQPLRYTLQAPASELNFPQILSTGYLKPPKAPTQLNPDDPIRLNFDPISFCDALNRLNAATTVSGVTTMVPLEIIFDVSGFFNTTGAAKSGDKSQQHQRKSEYPTPMGFSPYPFNTIVTLQQISQDYLGRPSLAYQPTSITWSSNYQAVGGVSGQMTTTSPLYPELPLILSRLVESRKKPNHFQFEELILQPLIEKFALAVFTFSAATYRFIPNDGHLSYDHQTKLYKDLLPIQIVKIDISKDPTPTLNTPKSVPKNGYCTDSSSSSQSSTISHHQVRPYIVDYPTQYGGLAIPFEFEPGFVYAFCLDKSQRLPHDSLHIQHYHADPGRFYTDVYTLTKKTNNIDGSVVTPVMSKQLHTSNNGVRDLNRGEASLNVFLFPQTASLHDYLTTTQEKTPTHTIFAIKSILTQYLNDYSMNTTMVPTGFRPYPLVVPSPSSVVHFAQVKVDVRLNGILTSVLIALIVGLVILLLAVGGGVAFCWNKKQSNMRKSALMEYTDYYEDSVQEYLS